jgi:hypothetical protein
MTTCKTTRRAFLAGAAALPALSLPAIASEREITLDDFRQAYAKLDPNAQAFLRALANEHAEVEIAAAGVDPIFAAIEKHQQAEAAFAGVYDNEEYRNAKYSTPATNALEERAGEFGVRSSAAYVELVKMTPTTLAGCAALLRHLEAHERSYDQPALLANHNRAKVAARDLLSRIAAALDATVQS